MATFKISVLLLIKILTLIHGTTSYVIGYLLQVAQLSAKKTQSKSYYAA